MNGEIEKGARVKVTGVSSTERGAEGVVTDIRRGWTQREAVVLTTGFRQREFSVPVGDLSKA